MPGSTPTATADGDSVGDAPYLFDVDGRDLLPSMFPFPHVEADIKANGSDGSALVSIGESVSFSIGMDTEGLSGQSADWWLVQAPPGGAIKSFNLTTGSFLDGFFPTHRGPLFSFDATDIPALFNLETGVHTFYFGIDTSMNGSINPNFLSYDAVVVEVAADLEKVTTTSVINIKYRARRKEYAGGAPSA